MEQTSVVAQIAEDRRVFSHAVPADLEALRRACQQPPAAALVARYYAGEEISDAPEWRELRVEIIGFRLTPDVSTVPVVFHPWVYDEFPQINGPCIVARWCHRYPGRPGFLEVGWDGRQGLRTPIRRSVHFLGSGTAEDAMRLMALWTQSTEAEPPEPAAKVRRHRSRANHLAQAVKAARYFQNHPTSPREPTEQDICDFIAEEEGIACPRSTLTTRWRRLPDYGEAIIGIQEVRRVARQ